MAKYQLFNNMNSPQPLSASQKGQNAALPLLLPAREGGWGDEYMKNV
jgi:hypothetical protein